MSQHPEKDHQQALLAPPSPVVIGSHPFCLMSLVSDFRGMVRKLDSSAMLAGTLGSLWFLLFRCINIKTVWKRHDHEKKQDSEAWAATWLSESLQCMFYLVPPERLALTKGEKVPNFIAKHGFVGI